MSSKGSKIKLDWDTVELVVSGDPHFDLAGDSIEHDPRLFPDRRGRSVVKKLMSGAAMKARAGGSLHTHVHLRHLIPAGLDTLVYGWDLVAAAVEGDNDLSRGIASAVRAIRGASERLIERQR